MLDILALAQECAPTVHPTTIQHVIRAESDFNPYAIGVVNGQLARQPQSLTEAVATVNWLDANGYNYSVGLMQVNKKNFTHYGLDAVKAFAPCANVRTGANILENCYKKATRARGPDALAQAALRDAFSCYYSGNFTVGYRDGYVQRVVAGPEKRPPSEKKPRHSRFGPRRPSEQANSAVF